MKSDRFHGCHGVCFIIADDVGYQL
jgi:hypothetical protein